MGERKSESFAKRSGAFLSVATCGNPQQLGAHKRWGGGEYSPAHSPSERKESKAKQREREREQANASPTEDGSHWGCLVYSDGACHSESKGKPRTGSSVQ